MKRGFTVIELMTVVSLFLLLVSVVLGAFSSGRSKGQDANLKSEMQQTTRAAEIYYITNNSYNSTSNSVVSCDINTSQQIFSSTIGNMQSIVNNLKSNAPAIVCGNNTNAWAIAIQLNTKDASGNTTYWCVDSSDVARGMDSSGKAYDGLTTGKDPAYNSGTFSCN